jgi:ADP-ribose 1''-phosphate phosphatase
MTVNYIKGNLLDVTIPSIIAHSCNTRGNWGGGFAYQLAQLFPLAEREYVEHCHKFGDSLIGKSLLIFTDRTEKGNELLKGQAHAIVCLFTSRGGGGTQDPPDEIIKNTKSAIEDLKAKLNGMGDHDYHITMPQINSGIFGVPWKKTEELLDKSRLDYNVYVL